MGILWLYCIGIHCIFFQLSRSSQQKLLDAVISTSIPFSFVDDPHVRDLFAYVGFQIPDKHTLRTQVMAKRLETERANQREWLRTAENITLVLDGWTDDSRVYYLSMLMIAGGRCEYVGNLSFGVDEGQTAAVIAGGVCDMVKEYVPDTSRIAAVVSDSARVMKVAVVKVVESIKPAVALVPCALHVMHLISQDVIKSVAMNLLYLKAKEVGEFFRESHYWSNRIREWSEENNTIFGIQTFAETRAFSFFPMFESIVELRGWFEEEFAVPDNLARIPERIREIILDEEFFVDLGILSKMFKKITTIVKALEADDATICDVWPAVFMLKDHFEDIRKELAPKYAHLAVKSLTAIDDRSKVLHADAFVLGLFLTPPYRQICVSGKYSMASLEKIIFNFGKRLNMTLNDAKNLIGLARNYRKGVGVFRLNENNAKSFWRQMPDSALKKLALRIVSILPHSAASERLLSRLTYIKARWQNRMSEDMLTGVAQIKMSLRADKKVNNERPTTSDAYANYVADTPEDLLLALKYQGSIELPFDEDDGVKNDHPTEQSYVDNVLLDFNYNLPFFEPAVKVIDTTEDGGYSLEDVLAEL